MNQVEESTYGRIRWPPRPGRRPRPTATRASALWWSRSRPSVRNAGVRPVVMEIRAWPGRPAEA